MPSLPSRPTLLRQPCSKLTNLRRLEVCGGGVTDLGVAHLAGLARLQRLSLAQVCAGWMAVVPVVLLLPTPVPEPQLPPPSPPLLLLGMCMPEINLPSPAALQNYRVGNPCISHLIKMSELTALNLSQVPPSFLIGTACLASRNRAAAAQCVSQTQRARSIRHVPLCLFAMQSRVTSNSVVALGCLPQLQTLALHETRVKRFAGGSRQAVGQAGGAQGRASRGTGRRH